MNDPEMLQELTYADIAEGATASFEVAITESLINNFSALSGDKNPLHMEESYAVGTPFKGRIAHGMIVGALFSRLIGMHLPGKYALYLSQSLRFENPIPPGTMITIFGEVTHKTDAHRTISVRTLARSADTKKILVSGEAMVQLLK